MKIRHLYFISGLLVALIPFVGIPLSGRKAAGLIIGFFIIALTYYFFIIKNKPTNLS